MNEKNNVSIDVSKIKNVKKAKAFDNFRKCYPITKKGEYIGVPHSATSDENQTKVKVNVFDLENLDKQYKSINFWLNYEFQEGDLTDIFFETFGYPEDAEEIFGQACIIEVDFFENQECTKKYPRIVGFGKIEN